MSVKPIPYGIADYKSIITRGYAYVDKTMYIRSLEQTGVYHLFLRPRRFGKSLFASMLGYYYDITEKDNFDLLFSNMDIGQHPTEEKNAYHVLKFNFSGVRSHSPEIMLSEVGGMQPHMNHVYGIMRMIKNATAGAISCYQLAMRRNEICQRFGVFGFEI